MKKINNRGGATHRGLCGCGNLVMNKGKDAKGATRYASKCYSCCKVGRREKKSYCEICNFIALDPVQLDIDHIDGNPSNNDKSNLQTLCSNCHRLKSKENNDWNKRKHEKVQ